MFKLQTREDSNSQKQEEQEASCHWSTPIHKPSMMSMVWKISIGQLGYLSGYALVQLLHTSLLVDHEKLGKSP